jgi:membrane protease YdiL (CAAX protease family)
VDTPAVVDETHPEDRRLTWVEVGIVATIGILPHYLYFLIPLSAPVELVPDSIHRIATYLPICLVTLYMMWRSEVPWKHFGLGRNLDGNGMGIFVSALLFGTIVIPLLSVQLQAHWQPSPEVIGQYDAAIPQPIGPPQWALLIAALFISAAMEELVVRGFLTVRLFDLSKNKVIAVLIPAVLFGGYHYYQGQVNCLLITAEAVVFGWMMISTRRLKSLILAHWAINVFIFWVSAYYAGTLR